MEVRAVSMRFMLALSLVASLAIADPANAVLKRYAVFWGSIAEFNTMNPSPNKYPPGPGGPTSPDQAIIDNTNNGSPVLKRLVLVQESSITVGVGLDGFVYLSFHSEHGSRKNLTFTGTGDTSTTIAWGSVTGWTVTGGFWCHSSPTALCSYSQGTDLGTVDPQLQSPFYDLGTWTFHGTGFTAVPFVYQVAAPPSTSVGNVQFQLKGRLGAGLVPAVPVLGVALLGASLLLAGARLSKGK